MHQSRRNIVILSALLLILTAVCRVPLSSSVRFSFQLLFQISTAVLLAYAIWFFGNKWLSGLLVLSTVSCFYPGLTRNSFATFQLIVFAAAWYLVLVYALKREWVHILLDAMCIIALCNVLYQIVQMCGYDFIYKDIGGTVNSGQIVGLMSNTNETSALLAFCLPAFFRKRWFWFMPMMLLGFINTRVTGGVLAAIVMVIVFTFSFKQKWVWITGVGSCIIGGLLFYLFVDTPDIINRFNTWKVVWNLYSQKWIMGFGLGHFQNVFVNPVLKAILGANFAQAHNDLLQGVFEMGIGFVVLVCGYFISIIRRANKAAILSLAAITGIVVNSLVNFPFHIAITAMVAITWMAILQVELNDIKRPDKINYRRSC